MGWLEQKPRQKNGVWHHAREVDPHLTNKTVNKIEFSGFLNELKQAQNGSYLLNGVDDDGADGKHFSVLHPWPAAGQAFCHLNVFKEGIKMIKKLFLLSCRFRCCNSTVPTNPHKMARRIKCPRSSK
jgi:hypothetical protein